MENSFYNYPLLIKQLLISPLSSNPEQEIVDNENQRYDYKRLNINIHTLANALREIGIKKGDTIGVMAWDTIRYLEFFFAIPMMGAILHTINIRLSEQQILYTINHADDDILIVHHDFIEVINRIKKSFSRPIKIILLNSNKNNLMIAILTYMNTSSKIKSQNSNLKILMKTQLQQNFILLELQVTQKGCPTHIDNL